MSWFSDLFGRSTRSRQASAAPAQARELRAALETEQRMLAQEIEQVFGMYDERLKGMAKRLYEMDDDELEAEYDSLKSAQHELRTIVRRFEASVHSRQELERELREWQDRQDGGARAEIIRSELAVRNLPVFFPVQQENQTIDTPRAIRVLQETERPELDDTDHEIELEPSALPGVTHEQLIDAIRDATREAERWHAVPLETHDEDALLHIHHVRDLHTKLKQRDREAGIRRDRLALAIQTRE